MRVTRILDLIVLLLLATVLLMPRPDATVKPALAVDAELSDRVAELQSVLVGKPDDAAAALELANIYLDGHRPDWALATVGPLARVRPDGPPDEVLAQYLGHPLEPPPASAEPITAEQS